MYDIVTVTVVVIVAVIVVILCCYCDVVHFSAASETECSPTLGWLKHLSSVTAGCNAHAFSILLLTPGGALYGHCWHSYAA